MTKNMNFRIKLLIFLLPVFFIVSNSSGQNASLSLKVINGKKCSLHLIKAKETWTAIARESKISLKELQDVNRGITDLKIGEVIYVPVAEGKYVPDVKTSSTTEQVKPKSEKLSTTVKPTLESDPVAKKENYIFHKVIKGETLYSISKLYKQPILNVMKWNNLKSNDISLGSNLIVGIEDLKPEKAPNNMTPLVKNETDKPINAVEEYNKQVKETAAKPANENKTVEKAEVKGTDSSKTKDVAVKDLQPGGVEQVTETGVATWFNDQELNQNKFYALHRTAPIGTIIKVTNRMNNNSVFVKVVGVLPATGDNDNIIIKITSAAAQRIGAIDQRFTAELTYGVTH